MFNLSNFLGSLQNELHSPTFFSLRNGKTDVWEKNVFIGMYLRQAMNFKAHNYYNY